MITCIGISGILLTLMVGTMLVIQIVVLVQLHDALSTIQDEIRDKHLVERLEKGLDKFEKLNVSAVEDLIEYAHDAHLLQLTVDTLHQIQTITHQFGMRR